MARKVRGVRTGGARGWRGIRLRTAAAFLAFTVGIGSLTGMACAARAVAAEVAAEAVGYLAENAFFEGDLGDGIDFGRNLHDKGGSRKGSEAGLYGGSKKIDICDPELLLEFLLEAGNGKKKAAWAKALGIGAKNKNVKAFVESLKEVVLANDTLVGNHGYRKGKHYRYEALLEAGTAVLVDAFGVPRVKCNCGNPLAVSDQDPGDIDPKFKGKKKGNKEWKVKKDQVVRVEKAEKPQKSLTVADVQAPAEEIEIDMPAPAGDGKPPREQVEIPQTRGESADEATRLLEEQGFTVETRTVEDPDVAPGTASGTEPEGGATAPRASTVTLLIAAEETGPQTVTVPDVLGWTQAEAEQALVDAGLVAEVATVPSTAEEAGLVLTQLPAAGGEVEPGSTVTLTVGVEGLADGGGGNGGAEDGGGFFSGGTG
ncbi:PASTA domain-containing protein [Streptomyces sp. TRM66268-LWL]|uniref:PASTA domain-containing protein n=1 Tax=Streptomyces polyasparticus TaxID=2767826 RepID=A0ABR7SKT9_9ACTN|nr:DUF6777 domain-containing protein [Streptomyces polyasparticus]MBC9716091.1 PASTA domain-containing protein [Streptomyces polyasparticus]